MSFSIVVSHLLYSVGRFDDSFQNFRTYISPGCSFMYGSRMSVPLGSKESMSTGFGQLLKRDVLPTPGRDMISALNGVESPSPEYIESISAIRF